MQFSFRVRSGAGAQTDASEKMFPNGSQTKEKNGSRTGPKPSQPFVIAANLAVLGFFKICASFWYSPARLAESRPESLSSSHCTHLVEPRLRSNRVNHSWLLQFGCAQSFHICTPFWCSVSRLKESRPESLSPSRRTHFVESHFDTRTHLSELISSPAKVSNIMLTRISRPR